MTKTILGMMKASWNKWKQFVIFLGNVQIVVVLTIVYWLLMPFLAIPFKILADPLASRKGASAVWKDEDPLPHDMDFMRRQG